MGYYKKNNSNKQNIQKKMNALVGIFTAFIIITVVAYTLISLGMTGYAGRLINNNGSNWDGLIVIFYFLFDIVACPIFCITNIFASRMCKHIASVKNSGSVLMKFIALVLTNILITAIPLLAALTVNGENPYAVAGIAMATYLINAVILILLFTKTSKSSVSRNTVKFIEIILIIFAIICPFFAIIALMG